MRMKKILLVIAAIFCVATVSAQKWAVGGRVGSGLQAVGEYHFSDKNYVEVRLGMGWLSNHDDFSHWRDNGSYYNDPNINFELTGLYNWKALEFDWTPGAGKWFLDAGVGAGFAIRKYYTYVGVAGQAKFGFQLNSIPLKIAIDWTPIFGPEICYGGPSANNHWVFHRNYKRAAFSGYTLANFGVSAVYCF